MRLSYTNYVQAYKRKAAKLKKKGLEMESEIYSKENFDAIAKAKLRENEYHDANELYESMIDRQAYGSMTLKKAKSMKVAADALGIEGTTIQALREKRGAYDQVNAAIATRADELREIGAGNKEIATAIGVEFFGSPE